MKAQISISSLLMLLLALSAAAGLFVFINKIAVGGLSRTEELKVYPELPPQILSVKCYTDHGYVAVDSQGLNGTVLYEVENLNGTPAKKGELSLDITDYGEFYFGALMSPGEDYSLRLYTPKWEVTDTCTANLNEGVVLYLPFDDTAKDLANKNDGTVYGGSDGTINGAIWTSGHSGNALSFNGSTDYVNLGQPSEFNLTDEVSMSAWIFTKNEGSPHTVISRGYAYMINAPFSNSLEFYGHDGTDFTICTYPWNHDDQWVHVAVTIRKYTGSWTIKGYVNGTEVCSSTNINFNGPRDAGETVNIGRLSAGPSRYFNGTIDEVRIYDRALNSTEVSQLYQGQDVHKGLVGYWNFDAGSGTSARDTHVWATGKQGGALYTDGINDYVVVPDSDELDVTTSLSLGFWMNKIGSYFGIISKDGVGPDTTGAYNAYVRDDLSLQYDVNNIDTLQTSANTVSLGNWYYVLMTFDSTKSPSTKIFLNGSLVKLGSTTIPYILGTDLIIGRRGVGSFFKGFIDEVKIYDRALSDEEVSAIFSAYQKG